MFKKGKIKIVEIKIGTLKPAEYNPRQMSKAQANDLEKSIKEFGLVDPLIVNQHKGRENIVMGGHQRLKIASNLGFKTVPVVYVDLDEKREKELNLRLNKNLGEWNWDLLANFEIEELKDVGFEEEELMMNFDLNGLKNVDEERFEVLSVMAPESPRLKERVNLECKSFENYEKIKKYIDDNGEEEIIEKILELI